MKNISKSLLKIFTLFVLPIGTLITFINVGSMKAQLIYAREGSHRTMTGGIASIAWTYRGVYAMILVFVFSFLVYSKSSKGAKFLTFILLLITSLPLMFFMEIMVYFPLGLLIIPIVILVCIIPIFHKQT